MDSRLAVLLMIVLLTTVSTGAPVPDSADIIPLVDGLAYGGIPYGSISGQLSAYFGPYEPIVVGHGRRKTEYDDYTLQHL